MLWQSAIRLAKLGRQDEAIEAPRQSVERLETLRDPKAAWYADHLGRYRAGLSAAGLRGIADTSTVAAEVSGPRVLKLAMSADKAMATFLGSGLERVTPEIRRERLATCAGCPTRVARSADGPSGVLDRAEARPRAIV